MNGINAVDHLSLCPTDAKSQLNHRSVGICGSKRMASHNSAISLRKQRKPLTWPLRERITRDFRVILNFIPQKANLPVAFKSGYSPVAPTCFSGENPRRLDMARDLDAAVRRREFICLVGGAAWSGLSWRARSKRQSCPGSVSSVQAR